MSSVLQLRPFRLTVLHDKSGSDNAQVPATGTTLYVFRQGVTVGVTSPITVPYTQTRTIPITGPGRLKVGDSLQVNTDNIGGFGLDSIAADGLSITVTNDSGIDVVVHQDDRIVPITGVDVPPIFHDAEGTLAYGSSAAPLDATGGVQFYCPETRFDCIAYGGAIATGRLFADCLGGWVRSGVSWVNATDYLTVQQALDACPAGAVLYFPVGTYTPPSKDGWELDKAITIMGDASRPDGLTGGTLFTPFVDATVGTRESTVFKITAAGNVVIKDLDIKAYPPYNPATTPMGTGCGIFLETHGTFSNLRIEHVGIYGMGRDGVYLSATKAAPPPDPPASYLDFVSLEDVNCNQCRRHGIYIQGAVAPAISGGYLAGNGECGLKVDESAYAHLTNIELQSNVQVALGGGNAVYLPQIYLRGSQGCHVVGCYFEDFNGGAPNGGGGQPFYGVNALTIENCFGGFIGGCVFINNLPNISGCRSIHMISTTCGWTVGSNEHREVDKAVEISGTNVNGAWGNNSGNVILSQAIRENSVHTPGDVVVDPTASDPVCGYNLHYGRVTLGDGNAENGSANHLAGLVLPRVLGVSSVTAQKDAGLFVFDKNAQTLQTWDGVAWRKVTVAAGSEVTSVGGTLSRDTVGKVTLTNQAPNNGSGAFPATQVIQNVPGSYLVTIYAVVRSALNNAMSFTLRWTDGQGNRSVANFGGPLSAAVGSFITGSQTIESASGNVTIEGNTGRTGAIDFRVRAVPVS